MQPRFSVLTAPKAPSAALGIAVAVCLFAVETSVAVLLKQQDPKEPVGLLYLIGVVVISTVWGVGVATAMSVVSALALVYLRDWPSPHFVPFQIENGVVIAILLVVSLSTNFVAGLARARAVETDLRRRESNLLAEQHAALRRVATLVARCAAPSQLFAAVADEMAQCLLVNNTKVARYEGTDAAIIVASHEGTEPAMVPVGSRVTLDCDTVAAQVLQTARTARKDDYEQASGCLATRMREAGIHSVVGAPIIVDGRVWGALFVGATGSQPLPAGTEERVADFAELITTALANAATRDELIASRARIVAAADNARRRIERDLHDGAQQRLVALGLQLRALGDAMPAELDNLKATASEIVAGLTAASGELREISRGIHPAILSKGGLGAALKTLARRSPVPVALDVNIDRRLTESAEVAAYYLIAEALTNTAKHAHASEVLVRAETTDENLTIVVEDDGHGGADPRRGSGLIGLKDRVEALGGRIEIRSEKGRGTSLHAVIPHAQLQCAADGSAGR
jgi:signal transduction histidine kinase